MLGDICVIRKASWHIDINYTSLREYEIRVTYPSLDMFLTLHTHTYIYIYPNWDKRIEIHIRLRYTEIRKAGI